MKKTLVILALLFVLPLAYLIRNHTNYADALPPGLPADISIVEGQVISGRRTLFEDGRGYVVDVRTDLSYGEVLNFYAEKYGNDCLTGAPGMGAEFSVADFRFSASQINACEIDGCPQMRPQMRQPSGCSNSKTSVSRGYFIRLESVNTCPLNFVI